jgi:hypothetical protein
MNVQWFQTYTLDFFGSDSAPGATLNYTIDNSYSATIISGVFSSSGTLTNSIGLISPNISGQSILWTGVWGSVGSIWSGSIVNYYENGLVLVAHSGTQKMYTMPPSILTVL